MYQELGMAHAELRSIANTPKSQKDVYQGNPRTKPSIRPEVVGRPKRRVLKERITRCRNDTYHPGNKAAPREAAGDRQPDYSDGIMIALMVPDPVAQQIAVEGGLPPEELHITLAYLGKRSELSEPDEFVRKVLETLMDTVPEQEMVKGKVNGTGRFNIEGDKDVVYYAYDSPSLGKLRQIIVEALDDAEVKYSKDHGFTPHISALYVPKGSETPPMKPANVGIMFEAVHFVYGETSIPIKLGGRVDGPRVT
jgi:2'-5' RNA ligase